MAKPIILAVDDDQSMCELVEAALKKQGHRVVWRTRGDEGLLVLQDQDVDVVRFDGGDISSDAGALLLREAATLYCIRE